MKRIGVVLACIGVIFGTLVPAQPAAAATCTSTAKTPGFYDPKLYLVYGGATVTCVRNMMMLRVNASLQRYSSAAGRWHEVSGSEYIEKNWSSAYTEAWWDCAGLQAFLRTVGWGTAWDSLGAPHDVNKSTSANREVRCYSEGGSPLLTPP